MSFKAFALPALLALALTIGASAQQTTVQLDGDDITVTGCVTRAATDIATAPDMLVWTRGDLMLGGAVAAAGGPIGTSGLANRIIFWLDDDEDLSEYIGQRVEIEGDVEDIEKGKIEIERDGDYTEIELELDGEQEKARVPTAWLGPAASDDDDDVEFEIAARKIDVEDVRTLGPCVP